MKSNHNCLVHNAESIYYLLCLFEAGSQLKLSARIETSVLLYRHCAAEVIGLAKSCLLAENSWEKNRHYCSREKCYFFSTSSTADPAVQYYSISCWERPTVRPKNYKGDSKFPLGPLQRPLIGQKVSQSVLKTFKLLFDLVHILPKAAEIGLFCDYLR